MSRASRRAPCPLVAWRRKVEKRKRAALGTPCPFCGTLLVAWNATFDHEPALAELSRLADEAQRRGCGKQRRTALRKMYKPGGRICCGRCNNRKGVMSFEHFRAWLAGAQGRSWLAVKP